ncbi:coiled-coil domain-containing protein 166-like, partial [Sceloporus undulatus]|uniref:coiled-coil domain-containing protein 166-like n=1 Tax=Sceloporus undulatus TaxID=8520 RepID=UPI001C4D53E4
HFRGENTFLDKEAQETRENSRAYLTYLSKRTLRCQNAIITLNDQNRSDLEQVLKQKEELTSQYTDKEKEVRSQLIEMETKFSLMNKEVEELKPFKELQAEQLARIRELERDLLAMKIHHSEQMHRIKSRFLQQKAEYEAESQQKVQALAKRAEKEAVRSLIQHTKQIKAENLRLRKELLDLIRRAQGLKAIVHQLREQKRQLLRELHYSQGLAHRRRWLVQRRPPRQPPPESLSPLGKRGLGSPPATGLPAPANKGSPSPIGLQPEDILAGRAPMTPGREPTERPSAQEAWEE